MRVLIFSLLIILADQTSKLWVRYNLEYKKSYRVIGEWIRLTFVENAGMVLGIEFGGQPFFTLFAFLATVVILVLIVRARAEKLQLRITLSLIFGGAVGNLVDRFLYGKVVDFIDIRIGGVSWPIFNIADVAVTIGILMLITMILFDKAPEKPSGQESD